MKTFRKYNLALNTMAVLLSATFITACHSGAQGNAPEQNSTQGATASDLAKYSNLEEVYGSSIKIGYGYDAVNGIIHELDGYDSKKLLNQTGTSVVGKTEISYDGYSSMSQQISSRSTASEYSAAVGSSAGIGSYAASLKIGADISNSHYNDSAQIQQYVGLAINRSLQLPYNYINSKGQNIANLKAERERTAWALMNASPALKNAIQKIRESSSDNRRQAIIDFYQIFGTHYISRIQEAQIAYSQLLFTNKANGGTSGRNIKAEGQFKSPFVNINAQYGQTTASKFDLKEWDLQDHEKVLPYSQDLYTWLQDKVNDLSQKATGMFDATKFEEKIKTGDVPKVDFTDIDKDLTPDENSRKEAVEQAKLGEEAHNMVALIKTETTLLQQKIRDATLEYTENSDPYTTKDPEYLKFINEIQEKYLNIDSQCEAKEMTCTWAAKIQSFTSGHTYGRAILNTEDRETIRVAQIEYQTISKDIDSKKIIWQASIEEEIQKEKTAQTKSENSSYTNWLFDKQFKPVCAKGDKQYTCDTTGFTQWFSELNTAKKTEYKTNWTEEMKQRGDINIDDIKLVKSRTTLSKSLHSGSSAEVAKMVPVDFDITPWRDIFPELNGVANDDSAILQAKAILLNINKFLNMEAYLTLCKNNVIKNIKLSQMTSKDDGLVKNLYNLQTQLYGVISLTTNNITYGNSSKTFDLTDPNQVLYLKSALDVDMKQSAMETGGSGNLFDEGSWYSNVEKFKDFIQPNGVVLGDEDDRPIIRGEFGKGVTANSIFSYNFDAYRFWIDRNYDLSTTTMGAIWAKYLATQNNNSKINNYIPLLDDDAQVYLMDNMGKTIPYPVVFRGVGLLGPTATDTDYTGKSCSFTDLNMPTAGPGLSTCDNTKNTLDGGLFHVIPITDVVLSDMEPAENKEPMLKQFYMDPTTLAIH